MQEEEEGWFDPHLKSKNMTTTGIGGVKISNIRILAPSGRQVNTLIVGKSYTLEYCVDCSITASKVGVGMMIKNKTGIQLGGTGSYLHEEYLKTVEPKDKIKVSIEFSNILHPGIYFITTSIGGRVNGKEELFCNLLDAVSFQVISPDKIKHTGIVDFNILPKLKLFN